MRTMNYGAGSFPVPIDERDIFQVLTAKKIDPPDRSVRQIVEDALDAPIGAGPLSDYVSPGDRVCVIISDVTRRWQRCDLYLPALIDRLNAAGIPDGDILLLSATGTHRAQSREEQIALVGEELFRRIPVTDHDCDDQSNLKYMGTTRRGTPVWLNAKAMACDKIILTGGVVYHYLAGYGGGRKSVVPGIAGRKTINTNHNNALNPGFGQGTNAHVRCGCMTKENPFSDDLTQAAALAKPCYLLNVVADSAHHILRAFAGDWQKAHQAAADLVREMDGVRVPGRADVVIASAGGYPKDINLYQSSKTLANALEMVKPGGTMILLIQCAEGFGDGDCQALITGCDTMAERETRLRANFSIGGYVGYMFPEAAENHDLILVTDMDAALFAKTKIHVARSLDAALAIAEKLKGGLEGLSTALMPNGANTFPLLPDA